MGQWVRHKTTRWADSRRQRGVSPSPFLENEPRRYLQDALAIGADGAPGRDRRGPEFRGRVMEAWSEQRHLPLQFVE